MEQVAKGAAIGLHAALICREHVAHENDSGVSDQGIEVTALNLLGRFQVLFGHLEKNLDVPTLIVEAHDIFSGRLGVR